MFKVGDKLQFLKNRYGYKKNEIVILTAYKDGSPMIPCKEELGNGYTLFLTYLKQEYIIIKKEINNDLDWLNAIQDNFKEGI